MNRFCFSTFLILFLSVGQSQAAPRCQSVFDHSTRVEISRTRLQQFEDQIEKVYSGSILGLYRGTNGPQGVVSSPQFYYQDIKNLLVWLERNPELVAEIRSQGLSARLQGLVRQNQQRARAILEAHQGRAEQEAKFLRYLDYNLPYFQLFELANRKLGLSLFVLPELSKVKSNQELNQDARHLVARLEDIVENKFADSGFKSMEEFEAKARAHDPLYSRYLEVVKNHLVVATHIKEEAREWIPLIGFQNLRTLGRGVGDGVSSDGASGRDGPESSLTNTNYRDYVQLSPRLKPIYAEARPATSVVDIFPSWHAESFGDDIWIFKNEITPTVTWIHGDTHRLRFDPQPEIDHIVMPWKVRSFMVSRLPLRANTFIMEKYPSRPTTVFYPDFSQEPLKVNLLSGLSPRLYFEVQVWGPKTLDDVKEFHFQNNPPSAEFYSLLTAKGIEVWDARAWPPKRYFAHP